MQPLRKISDGTRRFVRKISGVQPSAGRQPISEQVEAAAVTDLPSPSHNGTAGKTTHDIDIRNNFNEVSVHVDNFKNINITSLKLSFFETLLNPRSYEFFDELRESDC